MFSTLLILSPLTIVLISLTIVVYIAIFFVKNQKISSVLPTVSSFSSSEHLLEPPSPRKWPVIGHLHLMGGVEVPYEAFSRLCKKYGNIVKLQLGTVKCVVINGQKNIREALVTKGHHFDSRPNFQRYQRLFSGNKENSLAFCDWSDLQKNRRDMLKAYTFPRAFTNKFATLDNLISQQTAGILTDIQPNTTNDLKPIILRRVANIFLTHFCSKTFDVNDTKLNRMVTAYDEIFYEVNQGYAADFLPFLMPFHKKNLEKMGVFASEIREFIHKEVIGDRYDNLDVKSEPSDYLDSLIKHVKISNISEMNGEENNNGLDWEAALFALEDILGGHSAVGNFLIKLFAFLVNEPEVQRKIQEEIEHVTGKDGRPVSICDRNAMPYTEATVFEAIRLIASPIVPRVANQDSSIGGYRIEKGSVLFLNNYDLSMSEELWDSPTTFSPERFVRQGQLSKPDHFLPFGGGRRSCMGYKLVQLVSFGVLGSVLQKFTVKSAIENQRYKVPVGSLALRMDTFKFRLESR